MHLLLLPIFWNIDRVNAILMDRCKYWRD